MNNILNKIQNKIDELKTKKYWKNKLPKILASLVKGIASNLSKK